MYEGKKVFFILPHEIVREHLVEVLSDNEYEVYTINDQSKIDALVNRYPDSIFYINIDSALNELEWKKYIKNLIEAHPGLQVGVISGRVADQAMSNEYIMDVGVSCGVIQLRQGTQQSTDAMLKILEANEARGRRKYLRYKCGMNDNINLNFTHYNSQIIGHILDISSVGLSCTFEDTMDLSKNQLVTSVQLKLSGVLITTDCVVIGSRDDRGALTYVFLFRQAKDSSAIKTKIRGFIHNSLQKELEKSL